MHLCPLCRSTPSSLYHQDKAREYFQCSECCLVFVPTQFHLSLEEEKAVYDLHENDIDDPGYREFLSRLATPMFETLLPNSCGLDFGCGPGPALADMCRQRGHKVALFDPFYQPNTETLQHQYDFITCTEVLEHLREPDTSIPQILGLLKPGGLLAVMTKLVIDKDAFKSWHYKNDPTHIAFFSRDTFEWLASKHKLTLEFIDKDVIFLRQIESSE